MAPQWCSVCCTQHLDQQRCPGDIAPTGPETEAWKVTVETPRGMQGYGVLLAEVGDRWRARILTYPNILWLVPGGAGSLKFLGRSESEAQFKATNFIRTHCVNRGYVMRDEIELVETEPANDDPIFIIPHEGPREPRFSRQLPVTFGESLPTMPGNTRNLSETGLFVSTDSPMGRNSTVGVILQMEHLKVPLRGSVVWSRHVPQVGRPAGMGLRLLDPPPEYTSYVKALG